MCPGMDQGTLLYIGFVITTHACGPALLGLYYMCTGVANWQSTWDVHIIQAPKGPVYTHIYTQTQHCSVSILAQGPKHKQARSHLSCNTAPWW